MHIELPYNDRRIEVEILNDTIVYHTSYPKPLPDARTAILQTLRTPIGCPSLAELLKKKKPESVVIVVSDITRPIPYADFLDVMLDEIAKAGVDRESVSFLIANGMHRPSTEMERERILGKEICCRYAIIDHYAENSNDLVRLSGKSWAGRSIELNRRFVAADFRIVTGLVEPHFMAGFSGGRKAVCPGICSLETIKAFHSFSFLSSPFARNGNLIKNPLHQEALSIARQAGVDFCLNVLTDTAHSVVGFTAGELEASHAVACRRVKRWACPTVEKPADVVLTTSGGYPLDATFYQCVKGMTSCLPAVKKGGVVVSIGGCREGVGGTEYRSLVHEYAGRWREFLYDLEKDSTVRKDQWEFQMQTRVLKHVGEENLYFLTSGLEASELVKLSVNGFYAKEEEAAQKLQALLDRHTRAGKSLAIIPEGPYCAPLVPEQARSKKRAKS